MDGKKSATENHTLAGLSQISSKRNETKRVLTKYFCIAQTQLSAVRETNTNARRGQIKAIQLISGQKTTNKSRCNFSGFICFALLPFCGV